MCLQVVERVRRKAAIYGQDIEGDDTCFVGSNKAMAAIGDCDAQLQSLGCAPTSQTRAGGEEQDAGLQEVSSSVARTCSELPNLSDLRSRTQVQVRAGSRSVQHWTLMRLSS